MPTETWVASNITAEPKKSDLAYNWIRKNRETVIGSAVILLALALFGIYFFVHFRDLRDTAWKNLFIAQQVGYGGNTAQAQDLLTAVETTYGSTSAKPYAVLTKGDMLFSQGKFKEAGAEYSKLLTSKDLGMFAGYNLGKCLEAGGDLAGAQAQYSGVLTKYPDHFITPETHFSLARALELSGGKDAAKATYEKIILLYPDTAWAGQAKARLEGPAKK
ncbi:MAG TPA: hypothetical protein DCZ92_10140 [Elusimicrobia bacterium]|nr:MAG: hypothetical protein A2016_12550 [Elusimicrobia bacterium GWF2_62_30]HBA61159.1 hypothetical protein [Elusimicrobiota bacterium]